MLTLCDYFCLLFLMGVCILYGYGLGKDEKGRRISMKKVELGDIVYAMDTFRGAYIGKVVNIRKTPAHVAQVQILACLSYPKQYAEIFTDKPVERNPYRHLSTQNFLIENVGEFVGEIPDYKRSINNAINIAIKKCRPEELPILLRHCNRKGDYICAG